MARRRPLPSLVERRCGRFALFPDMLTLCALLALPINASVVLARRRCMSERSQVTVRLDPELLAKIAQAAASDRRPVSQYVRNLILDAVDGDRERQGERASER